MKVTGVAETNSWSSLAAWLVPIAVMIVIWTVMRRMGPGQSAMAFERSRAKIYAEDDVKVTFANVAGIEEATEELREIVEFLKYPKKYRTSAAGSRKGPLLGPPSTGKT